LKICDSFKSKYIKYNNFIRETGRTERFFPLIDRTRPALYIPVIIRKYIAIPHIITNEITFYLQKHTF